MKQALNEWPSRVVDNSIPTIQPSLESTTPVAGDNTSDDIRESEIDSPHKHPPVRNPQ